MSRPARCCLRDDFHPGGKTLTHTDDGTEGVIVLGTTHVQNSTKVIASAVTPSYVIWLERMKNVVGLALHLTNSEPDTSAIIAAYEPKPARLVSPSTPATMPATMDMNVRLRA